MLLKLLARVPCKAFSLKVCREWRLARGGGRRRGGEGWCNVDERRRRKEGGRGVRKDRHVQETHTDTHTDSKTHMRHTNMPLRYRSLGYTHTLTHTHVHVQKYPHTYTQTARHT
jgi:hypothetical protein